MAAFTASLMIGTAGLPHVIIRFFTVPTVQAARTSAGWALVFIAILYTTAPAVAAMARLNIIQTLEPQPGQHLAIEERPAWFKNWERTGLLGIEDKNEDGLIQYSADAETNELVKLDNDILVLANPEIANLPNWVIALVAAGGLAAALSTAAGLLLAISSSISHDLLKRTLMPHISERQELIRIKTSDGGCCPGRRVSRSQSAGLRSRHSRPGFWLGRRLVVSRIAAGHLFHAGDPGGSDPGHAIGHRRDAGLCVSAQRHYVHPGHQLFGGAATELVSRYRAQCLWRSGRHGEFWRHAGCDATHAGASGLGTATGGGDQGPDISVRV